MTWTLRHNQLDRKRCRIQDWSAHQKKELIVGIVGVEVKARADIRMRNWARVQRWPSRQLGIKDQDLDQGREVGESLRFSNWILMCHLLARTRNRKQMNNQNSRKHRAGRDRDQNRRKEDRAAVPRETGATIRRFWRRATKLRGTLPKKRQTWSCTWMVSKGYRRG